jgi:hypothetical protein
MTTTNPTLLATVSPAALLQAGKDAFAAGIAADACPYPIDDGSCDEQRFLWLRGHTIARYAAKGYDSAYADESPEEMLEQYRLAQARQEFSLKFAVAFGKMMNSLDDEGHPDIVRDVVIEWLCGGAESREDFIDEVEAVADDYDWPDADEEEGDAEEEGE